MNTPHSFIAACSLAVLSNLAVAGPDSVTEDFSTGPGLTTSFTAFAGTPAESQITSLGQIWIGDVEGLVSQLDNPFYNDTINFPDGTPVLAFGPSNLYELVEFSFPVNVTSITLTIYDIETTAAVRVTGFDENETETYNSGLLSATELNQTTLTTSFDPPIRELQIFANNSDGLMLSPINITYNQACSPADLNEDGEIDFADISLFISSYNNQDPIADLNDDGSYDFVDISAFLNAFTTGCP